MCRRRGIMIISDFAYGEICFDGYKAPSFLAAGGQGSWRGIHDHVQELQHGRLALRASAPATPRWSRPWRPSRAITTTASSPRFRSPASSPCASTPDTPDEQSEIYQQRRDVVCRGLDRLGWTYEKPRASMFVWAKIKPEHFKGEGTIEFCLRMMEEAEVALSPGRAFGENGEGYVRIALVENDSA
jgi:alanine-synthesizing transaminase